MNYVPPGPKIFVNHFFARAVLYAQIRTIRKIKTIWIRECEGVLE